MNCTNAAPPAPIPYTPPEMWAHIFSFLDEVDTVVVGLVCKDFREINAPHTRVLFGAKIMHAILGPAPTTYGYGLQTPHGDFKIYYPYAEPISVYIIFRTDRADGRIDEHTLQLHQDPKCQACSSIEYYFQIRDLKTQPIDREYRHTFWYEQICDGKLSTCNCSLGTKVRGSKSAHHLLGEKSIRICSTFTLCSPHTISIPFINSLNRASIDPFGQQKLTHCLDAMYHLFTSIGRLRTHLGKPRPLLGLEGTCAQGFRISRSPIIKDAATGIWSFN